MDAKVFKMREGHDPVVLEVEEGYFLSVVEMPEGLEPEEFVKTTEKCDGIEIVKGAHFCPHVSPSRFDKFRKGVRKDKEGEPYDVFYGRVVDTDRWEIAATSYPADKWDNSSAREHCKHCGGVAFQKSDAEEESPASNNESLAEEKVSWDEIVVKSIKKSDDLRHLVYGVALEPGEVDLQGDTITEEEVEKAAHRFMVRMREEANAEMVGDQHERPLPSVVPVESYIASVGFDFPGGPVKKGSWVLVSYVPDEEEFKMIRSGERTGYSIQGTGRRRGL